MLAANTAEEWARSYPTFCRDILGPLYLRTLDAWMHPGITTPDALMHIEAYKKTLARVKQDEKRRARKL